MKKLLIISSVFVLLNSCNSETQGNTSKTDSASTQQTTAWNKAYGGADKAYDLELLKLRDEIAPKFQTLNFNDSVSGKTMTYNLFIPKGYDKNKSYPLILFMADGSTTGKGAEAPLKQGYGGIIWATDESQAENPSFVLVPAYAGPENAVNDNWETSDEVDMTLRLLKNVVSNYSIDSNRLYTTGQSMGGMISFYLNATNPDLFAASLFVGSQWNINVLKPLIHQKFFYIVSAGDPKASKGMKEVGELLTENGVEYGKTEFSAKLSQEEQEQKIADLLKEGNAINFVAFTKGTVIPNSSTDFSEHMYSFDYAYKLKGVRDWLFKQTKGSGHVGQTKVDAMKQLNQGIAYFNGNGVEKNYKLAKTYFLKAWEQGHMKAARYLGMIYEEGLSVNVDYSKALQYYKLSAEAGDITSYGKIGLMYEKGLGVNKNYKEATKWYVAATSNRQEVLKNIHPRVTSLLRLGHFYEQGLGKLKADKSKALEYYKIVAQSDNPEDEVAVLEAKERIRKINTVHNVGLGASGGRLNAASAFSPLCAAVTA